MIYQNLIIKWTYISPVMHMSAILEFCVTSVAFLTGDQYVVFYKVCCLYHYLMTRLICWAHANEIPPPPPPPPPTYTHHLRLLTRHPQADIFHECMHACIRYIPECDVWMHACMHAFPVTGVPQTCISCVLRFVFMVKRIYYIYF